MTRARIAGGTLIAALVIVGMTLVVRDAAKRPGGEPDAETSPSIAPSVQAGAEARPGFLYGRITDDAGTYEGRLRWGRDQEAFWGDYFNGVKAGNPWSAHAALAEPPGPGSSLEIFGLKVGGRDPIDLVRQFLARFGDIARIEAHLRTVRVTLKSGTSIELDRSAAGDIDDGVRVWNGARVVDIDDSDIRTIEFLPTAPVAGAPGRLNGIVRTQQGTFTGFIQWGRQDVTTDDELDGRAADGDRSLRYGTIRAIARRPDDGAQVTLVDGRDITLTGMNEVGRGNSGINVDDPRYGRVQISWDVFERVDFSPGGSGPAYDDYPPGQPLAGRVATRGGRSLAGRLVFDFDESETTETLDAPSHGVNYNIPFGLIASIVPPARAGQGDGRARVLLRDGEELRLERAGDLADGNAGLLIFAEGRQQPDFVPWTEIERIDFDAPAAASK